MVEKFRKINVKSQKNINHQYYSYQPNLRRMLFLDKSIKISIFLISQLNTSLISPRSYGETPYALSGMDESTILRETSATPHYLRIIPEKNVLGQQLKYFLPDAGQ